MKTQKLWTIMLVIFGIFWNLIGKLGADNISISVVANVPKNFGAGRISLEYEFYSSSGVDKSLISRDKLELVNLKDNPERKSFNNCREISYNRGSGIYNISINGLYKQVYCEVNPDGNNYLVFQRRVNGSLDFYRNWTEYENGFGNLNHEFWIGNQLLSEITSKTNCRLRIDLVANDSSRAYAEYNTFSVGPSETKYRLNVSGYSGNAGDSFGQHNGAMFSTFDQDNDEYTSSCAAKFRGAWWYKSCHNSNLNGFYYGGYHDSFADGMDWEKFKGYRESMKRTTMKIY